MKSLTPSQIRHFSLACIVFFLVEFIYFGNTITTYRDEFVATNPSLKDYITFEFTALAILFPIFIALFAASLSSWLTSTHSHILSRKKHFVTTVDDTCDKLINLIMSYLHNDEDNKELTKQKIFTYRGLCAELIDKDCFSNKEIFTTWEEVNSGIGKLICSRKFAQKLVEELNTEPNNESVNAHAQKLVEELSKEPGDTPAKGFANELANELAKKLANGELVRNLANKLVDELDTKLKKVVDELVKLRVMIAKDIKA